MIRSLSVVLSFADLSDDALLLVDQKPLNNRFAFYRVFYSDNELLRKLRIDRAFLPNVWTYLSKEDNLDPPTLFLFDHTDKISFQLFYEDVTKGISKGASASTLHPELAASVIQVIQKNALKVKDVDEKNI